VVLIPYQPIPMGVRSLTQGFLMNRRRTGVIALASLVKILALVVPGFWLVARDPTVNGTVLATVLIMVGGTLETVVVALRARSLHGELMAETDRGAAAAVVPGAEIP
jgi:hypothetical protein